MTSVQTVELLIPFRMLLALVMTFTQAPVLEYTLVFSSLHNLYCSILIENVENIP